MKIIAGQKLFKFRTQRIRGVAQCSDNVAERFPSLKISLSLWSMVSKWRARVSNLPQSSIQFAAYRLIHWSSTNQSCTMQLMLFSSSPRLRNHFIDTPASLSTRNSVQPITLINMLRRRQLILFLQQYKSVLLPVQAI